MEESFTYAAPVDTFGGQKDAHEVKVVQQRATGVQWMWDEHGGGATYADQVRTTTVDARQGALARIQARVGHPIPALGERVSHGLVLKV